MTNPPAAPAPAADTAAPQAPEAAVIDEVAAATPDNAGNRSPKGNKHKDEVTALLDAYEAKQARLSQERKAAPAPEAPPEGLRDGESWDSVYAAQPPEAQRAMAELRKTFTQKTQELSRERKKVEAQNKALMDSGLMDSLDESAAGAPQDFDPFNPAHIQSLIEAKVAARLKEVLEPMHKTHQKQEAVNKYSAFREANPDIISDPAIKTGVYKALQADPSLKLESAYWMVKGKALQAKQQLDADRAVVRDRARLRAAKLTDHGRRPGQQMLSPDLKDQSAWEIYETLKASRP